MSLPDDAADPRPGDQGGIDAEAWFGLLHRFAQVHSDRAGLDDFANDLAQQAFALLWERQKAEGRAFRAGDAERLVRSLADGERHARDVERRHLSLVRLDARGSEPPPEPCPRLLALAPAHARPGAFRTRLRVAAHCLARHPKILLDEQFRIFDLVWVAGAGVETAAELLGISAGAAHQRLQRASKRIENRLLRGLEPAMPACRWEELQAFLSAKGRRPPSRTVADATFAGLGRVIHIRSLLPEIA